MAQRFKSTDLKEMIRSLVRQEIKEVVAETINEVLSERYLRQLAESAVNRPRGVGDTMHIQGDDAIEEPPPHPLANSREWPFEKHPMKKDDKVDEEYEPSTDLDQLFFEGTKPLNEVEKDAPPAEEIETRLPKQLQEQTKVWTALAGLKKNQTSGPSAEDKVKYEEARIKRMREQLETKVG